MKSSANSLASCLWPLLIASTSSCLGADLFHEDFEHGLTRWTGKTGQTHHGLIVPDPLASGRGNVLTFTALNGFGDIFTISTFSSTNSILISFDYLGLAKPGSVAGSFEGYFGIANGLPGTTQNWLASTSSDTSTHLPDDGQWHHITILLKGPQTGSFRLTLEDYAASGVPGDAFFDNIRLTEWPLLTIEKTGISQVEVRWPANATDYLLESATSLPPQDWAQVTNTPVVVNDEFVIGFDIQPPHQFFRLRKQ